MIRCLTQVHVDAAHFRNLATNSLNRVSSGDKAGADDLFHGPRHSAQTSSPPASPEATVPDHHPVKAALQEIQATGVANSGTVNTGAFITGNDSNGILWRGNFEGLFSAYLGFTIEQFPLTYHAVGGIGPLHVAPVPISAAHFNITNASIGLGPFTIPEIHIPKIPIDVLGSVGLGQTTISDVTALNALNGGIGLSIGSFKFNDPFISIANFGNPNPPAIGFFISNLSITGPQISGLSIGSPIPLSLALGTTTWTLFPNGWTIPAQTPVTLGLSGGNDPFTFFPGGLTFPKASAGVINLSGGTDPFTLLPNGFQITTVPVLWDGTVLFGPIQIPIINVPPTPGFGNTTTTPSSGFFNSGDGGGSGFYNFGSAMSGWWNQAHSAAAGAGSGFANFGSLDSGVLNFGSGVSGLYNTGGLPPGTPAVVSGIGNVPPAPPACPASPRPPLPPLPNAELPAPPSPPAPPAPPPPTPP